MKNFEYYKTYNEMSYEFKRYMAREYKIIVSNDEIAVNKVFVSWWNER